LNPEPDASKRPAFAFTGKPAVTDLIENSLIARSPNMAGVRGCIITFKLAGDLR
jgi:hypothetical protein